MTLPKRAIPLILVALLVAGGAWLNYATPIASPVPPVPVAPAAPQPSLAPLPLGPVALPAPAVTTVTEVEVSYEIAPRPPTIIVAPPPKTPAPPPAARPAAKPPEKPQANCQPSNCQYYYRRGFLRRR